MHTLSINETKITTKNALHGDNVVTEGNHESNNDKEITWYFCRLLTSDLILRQQNTNTHVFRAFFD